MKPHALHPIVYVRGYAMTPGEIEDTVSDPYMGFNVGSCKVRQSWDGTVKKFFFESPLVRLLKEYGYDDVYSEGVDQIEDFSGGDAVVPYQSIIIFRYYEPSSQVLGTGLKPDIGRFAQQLSDLILKLRDRIYAHPPKLSSRPASKEDFRVHLIAHSMGGLICRAFLQNPKLGSDEARKLVDKVFTYATPHSGIEFSLGSVPSWLSLYGLNTFSRDIMAGFLGLQPGAAVDEVKGFNPDKIFNLVGTNPADYKVAAGLSSAAVGDASDGLVQMRNATTWGAKDGKRVQSPQAFVHRSHSGFFGIVNSEEGYQNLIRFLYGDVRADGFLQVDKLTLPPELEDERRKGRKVRASYLFEVVVSVRGKQWQLHRRTIAENSAIFRKYDDLFDKRTGQPVAGGELSLFSVFLDLHQRADKTRPTLAFAVDLTVRVPDYSVDGFLFLKNHFEGSYLFRDLLLLEAIPPADGAGWRLLYGFTADKKPVHEVKGLDLGGGQLAFEIPIKQPKPPGISARLRVVTRLWNEDQPRTWEAPEKS